MRRNLPLTFILLTVVLDAMGFGLIMPVMPELLQEVGGGNISQAALWGGILTAVFAAMNFLAAPTIGNLSDRYGRRVVLLGSLLVMMGDYLVMALTGSIWVLLLGRFIGGITAANQATALAYLADISPSSQKARSFGYMGAAFGVGFVLGPALGGLLGDLGTRAPFYAAAALTGLNLALGYFVLPESLPPEKRRAFSWRRANPLGAFRAIGALPGLGRLLGITLLFALAFMVYPVIWAFFCQYRFGWSPTMVGISLTLYGLSSALVQGLLVGPVINRLGERRAVQLGLSVEMLTMILVATISNPVVFLILTPISALGGFAGPAMQAMMSQRASDDQQGELTGVLSSLNAVAAIVSPLLMTQIFWFFTAEGNPQIPGAPFLLAAVLLAVCLPLLSVVPRRHEVA